MNTALAVRDDVTLDGEIIEAPRPAAPLTLFGTDDPAAVVERATRVATALADVIKKQHLSSRIGNRDHVQIEGWTLLGSMLGVFGEIEWTRPVERGWEARAVARTMAGATVGSAEAMCTRAERTWANRDEYAIRSMAQTRALSKALRLPLGFIVELAGFAATPAEEMDAVEQPERSERTAASRRAVHPSATTSAPAPKNKGAALGRLADVMKAHNLSFGAVDKMAADLGISRQGGSVEDIMRLIAAIEQPTARVSADGAAVPSVAAAPPDTAASEGNAPSTDDVPVTPTADAGPSLTPPGEGPVPRATSYTPDTLRTLAAAVLELDAAGDWKLESLDSTDWGRIFAALKVNGDGYPEWYAAQPPGIRAVLRAAKQAPADRKAAAKARPDAEQIRASLGGES